MLETITYKNYKTLCEALGWMVTGGNSKKAQINILDKICDYEKKGNKFIIKELYVTSLNDIQLIINAHDTRERIYDIEVQKSLVNLLQRNFNNNDNNNGGVFYSTRLQLAEDIGMFNINYKTGRVNKQKVSELLEMERRTVVDFYSSAESLIATTIDRVGRILTRLDSTGDFLVNKVFVGNWKDKDSIEIDSEGKERYDIYSKKLSEKQTIDLLKSQREALNSLGFKTIAEVFAKERFEDFYSYVDYYMKDKYDDYVGSFKTYEIIYSKMGLDYLSSILNSKGVNKALDLTKELNEDLVGLAKKRQEYSLKECTNCWGITKKNNIPTKNKIRNREDYVDNNKRLADVFISKEAEDMTESLSK